jgi:predicted nucleic acid-binding protein
MPRYFVDSSALAKVYHPETGTANMVSLMADPANELLVSSLTLVEIQSVFSQKVRDGMISEDDYSLLKRRFAADIKGGRLAVKNLLRPHQRAAERLLEAHARLRRLRTLDALQLGAAIEIGKISTIDRFVCADKHLGNVARLEGISLLNPDEG